MGEYYDLERAFAEAGLPPETVEQILSDVRAEFPDDPLMFELHVVRAIDAELAARMPAAAWCERVAAGSREMLERHGFEVTRGADDTRERIQRQTPRKSA